MDILYIFFTLVLLIRLNHSQEIPTYECNSKRSNTFCPIKQFNETHYRFKPVSNIPAKEIDSVNLVGYLGARMHTLTSDLCDAFPNIEIFNADFLGLEKIESNAFANCKKLDRVYLSRNKLEDDDLTENTFKNNLKIRSVLLEGNRLKKFNMRVFNNLQRLEELRLYRNEMEEFDVKNLTPLKKLDSLYLEYNQIADVDEQDIIKKFPNLKEISLCHNNKITSQRMSSLKHFFKARNVTLLCLNDDKFT